MEKTSINEQGGGRKSHDRYTTFYCPLVKRRIRDCPNIEIGKIITRTQNMIRIK